MPAGQKRSKSKKSTKKSTAAPVVTSTPEPVAAFSVASFLHDAVILVLKGIVVLGALRGSGLLEYADISLPEFLDKEEWFNLSLSVHSSVLAAGLLVFLNLASLASATEHKLTGGEYLGRKPVGLQDFEAVGLGALPNTATPAEMYLDVLKRSLVNLIYYESSHPIHIYGPDKKIKLAKGLDLYARCHGEDLPANAMSMIGMERMNNIQMCIQRVLDEDIEGDLIETGACKGGATIFMRGALKAWGCTDRKVFVCDTFCEMDPHASWIVHVLIGWVTNFLVSIPSHGFRHKLINMLWKGQKDFPQAANEIGEDEQAFAVFLLQNLIHMRPVPSVQKSFEHVKSNFARYGLLDDQVVFLKGWFSETIPKAPIDKIAILRMDGDTYESTIDALNMCYPKLNHGGFCIVDDYWSLEDCKRAVDEYREKHNITEEIIRIDGLSCYWQRR